MLAIEGVQQDIQLNANAPGTTETKTRGDAAVLRLICNTGVSPERLGADNR